MPNHFSEMPELLRGATKCSLVIAAASPPDRHGYFSLGTNADYVASLIGRAPFFLEANHSMPRTVGGTLVHISQVAGWCESDHPLIEVPPAIPGPKDDAIAALIAERVPNEATIQVGIGAIPNAVLAALSGHENLGLHTELLSDGVIDLVESGVLTGTHKLRRRNKHVATFCLGTRQLYDWLDGNEGIELLGVDWVNNPRIIAQEKNFVSINATTRDRPDGPVRLGDDGRPLLVLQRRAGRLRARRDVLRGRAGVPRPAFADEPRAAAACACSSTPGSVVTTLKNTVDHVVTEYGVAELRGRSLRQRAQALIAIAHPDHRDSLTAEARDAGLLH